MDAAGDWSYHDYRNADIESFYPAIEEIVSRGGFVLRIGAQVVKPLGIKSERVIDYARERRSDFMDIFLIAKCRFFLGTSSGVGEVSMLFDRPRVGVDWAPFGNAPLGKQSLVVPKLVSSAATGENLTFGELLRDFAHNEDPKLWDGNLAYRLGYRYVDNTPEEILMATREMLDRLEGTFEPSAEDHELQQAYFALMPADHYCIGIKTPVAAGFLKLHRHLLERG